MHKKFLILIFLCNVMFMLCWFNVEKIADAKATVKPAFQMEEANEKINRISVHMEKSRAVSVQRVVDVNVLEAEHGNISREDYEVLLNIVEAEAGCEDEEGKLLVANVILNRVENPGFPDTIKEVVFQKENGTTQFSPVSDGSYYQVTVSEQTKNAVERALCGEDISKGALYFAARQAADPEKMQWFDENLELLFAHGGHEFFH